MKTGKATQTSIQKINSNSEWMIVQKISGSSKVYWADSQGVRSLEGAKALEQVALLEKKGFQKIEADANLKAHDCGFDLQTHLRYPGQSDRETLEGGLNSALVGGYDSLISMPNTSPFLDRAELLQSTIQETKIACSRLAQGFQVYFSAAGTVEMKGLQPTPIKSLAQAGAVCITDDGWGTQDDGVTREIFRACEENQLPFFQHCEMGIHHGVASPSRFQKAHGLKEYPRESESQMLKRDLSLLSEFPQMKYHALHLSTRESVDAVRRAKDQGLQVTCEVSPHHLFFSNEDIPSIENSLSVNYKMNPPLFDPRDRAELQKAFQDGTIDFISTDHAPHSAEVKAKGWSQAPFGTRGLETCFSVLWTLAQQLDLSEERIRHVFSAGPRKLMGLEKDSHGIGNIFLFDPQETWQVQLEDLPGISKNSCFLGAHLVGRIRYVILQSHVYQVNLSSDL